MNPEPLKPAEPLDRADARVRHDDSLRGALRDFTDRLRSGDLGMLPVVVGLVLISTVFSILNPVFLAPNNLVNLLFDCATVGVIALGIVCVLMLGSDVGDYPYYLRSVAQIFEDQQQWDDSIRSIYEEWLDDEPEILGAGIDADVPMSKRLCFSHCMNNGGSSMLYLDFDPADGGTSGQVDAIKLAIAKAITVDAPDLRSTLKKADLLSRDPREKERKKYGLRSARKREQFSKR